MRIMVIGSVLRNAAMMAVLNEIGYPAEHLDVLPLMLDCDFIDSPYVPIVPPIKDWVVPTIIDESLQWQGEAIVNLNCRGPPAII